VAEVKEKKREMETMNKTPHGIFTRHEKKKPIPTHAEHRLAIRTEKKLKRTRLPRADDRSQKKEQGPRGR
jgi:hypothetical protein